MIQPWSATLNENGTVIDPVIMPSSTAQLDGQIEEQALLGQSLVNPGQATSLSNTFTVGIGNNIAEMIYSGDVTTSGFYAGSSSFANAPFSVNLLGATTLLSANIGSPTGAGLFLGNFDDPISGLPETGIQFRNTSGDNVGVLLANSSDIILGVSTDELVGSFIDIEQSTTGGITVGGYAGVSLITTGGGNITLGVGNGSPTTVVTVDYTTTGVQLGADTSQGLGFYGSTPKNQIVIFGSQGGNTALSSLISALSQLGLIHDATTP